MLLVVFPDPTYGGTVGSYEQNNGH